MKPERRMEHTHRIIDLIWKTPNVFELLVERRGLAFTPGDSVAIAHSGGSESRPYSMASGAEEEVLRFLIQVMPNGLVSNDLANRQPGDSVLLSAPFGWFHPGRHSNGRPVVFVATGTGIAPFLSYLRTYPEPAAPVCLYGARRAEDLLECEVLRTGCTELHLAVSREDHPHYPHGRVTDLLTSLSFATGTHFYLCGLDAMIEDVTALLEERGVHFSHIHREVFFYAAPAQA